MKSECAFPSIHGMHLTPCLTCSRACAGSIGFSMADSTPAMAVESKTPRSDQKDRILDSLARTFDRLYGK